MLLSLDYACIAFPSLILPMLYDQSIYFSVHNYESLFVTCGQKYVADFYVSDFQSGFRAQVKTGYGAKVAPFVKPSTIVDITKGNRELSPSFLRWLTDRSLSSDDRIMRLEEG